MTFNQFCKTHGVTENERQELLLFLAILRVKATLGIKVYDD